MGLPEGGGDGERGKWTGGTPRGDREPKVDAIGDAPHGDPEEFLERARPQRHLAGPSTIGSDGDVDGTTPRVAPRRVR